MDRPALFAILSVIACSGPAREFQHPPPQDPYLEIGVAVAVEEVPSPSSDPGRAAVTAPRSLDQPAHVKLELGHYRNDRYNVGVTIDLTEHTENVADIDPAKLRFDGESWIWRLDGRRGRHDRIDYLHEGRVMLHVREGRRMSIYVRDPETDRASEEIHLYRDGDADPL